MHRSVHTYVYNVCVCWYVCCIWHLAYAPWRVALFLVLSTVNQTVMYNGNLYLAQAYWECSGCDFVLGAFDAGWIAVVRPVEDPLSDLKTSYSKAA